MNHAWMICSQRNVATFREVSKLDCRGKAGDNQERRCRNESVNPTQNILNTLSFVLQFSTEGML